MAQITSSEILTEWRKETFIRLGFDDQDAEALAEARDHKGWLIETHAARKLINAGCTPELAFRILI